jgi:hypothetical protein
MKTSLLFLTAFFTTITFAANLKIQETLKGRVFDLNLATVKDETKKSFDEACTEWKKAVSEVKVGTVLYNSCGSRGDYKLKTYTWDRDAEGNSYQSPGPFYGMQSSSTTQLVIDTADVVVDTISENIEGGKFSCANYKETGKCLEAMQKAWNEYYTLCADFKANAKKQLGAKLVYVTCGSFISNNGPTSISSSDYNIELKSVGIIYFKN